ncbi:hypothetical protein [Paracoccus sp. SCSIO 75233]|uniref:hypothetical protein n=1 Tax=Paracoccus sp. SCSIO 75233 TaxID=3017782 RepID=UPI0034A00399
MLRCADGRTSNEAAVELGHFEHMVCRWQRRFTEHRIKHFSNEYRSKCPQTISDAQVSRVRTRSRS